MKIAIVKDDSVVGVDGEFRSVDVSDLDDTIQALQFNTTLGRGRIWFKAETDKGQADLESFTPYQVYLDRWVAAAPIVTPPPPPVDQSDLDLIQKQLRAAVNLTRLYCNAVLAGTYTNKTPAQTKADFKQVFDNLP